VFCCRSIHMTGSSSQSVGALRAVSVGNTEVASSARLLLCARCAALVLVCRSCDRGQRYCGRACSTAARKQAQREAAQRYQSGQVGRAAHAARSRRWRARQRLSAIDLPAVTHQGGTGGPEEATGAPQQPPQAPSPQSRTLPLQRRCICCSGGLSPWMRWGPLRHRRQRRRCRHEPTATPAADP
jgi:hypothetical protein